MAKVQVKEKMHCVRKQQCRQWRLWAWLMSHRLINRNNASTIWC